MTANHLSDAELQACALQPAAINATAKTHLQTCAQCQAAIANYTIIVATLAQAEKPVFDFDVAALVLPQLPMPVAHREATPVLVWPFLVFTVALLGAAGFALRKVLLMLFANLSAIGILLIAGTALLLFLFQCADVYRQYKRRLHQIEFA